jgi:hypothetical protein
MRHRIGFLIAAVLLASATPGFAQIDNPTWGLEVGFTPSWQMPGQALAGAFGADQIDLHGSEFRIGVVRGRTMGGEWGVSLVNKRFGNDGIVVLSSSSGKGSFTTTDAEMLGFEVHRFFALATIAKQVQIGVNLAGGAGELRGYVDASYVPSNPTQTRANAPVRTRDIFDYVDKKITWLPMAKAELGVAVLAGERMKVRVTGGLNFPGYEVASVSVTYLMGHDR